MTEGAKLVTDDPGIPDKETTDEPLDTKRPVALSGDTHEHLEKNNKNVLDSGSAINQKSEGCD